MVSDRPITGYCHICGIEVYHEVEGEPTYCSICGMEAMEDELLGIGGDDGKQPQRCPKCGTISTYNPATGMFICQTEHQWRRR